MRALQQYVRAMNVGEAQPVVTLGTATLPPYYHRDYYYLAHHDANDAGGTLYVYRTKAEARQKNPALGGHLGTGVFTLGTTTQVNMIKTAELPDITGMIVPVTCKGGGSILTQAWNEVFGLTANFGYEVADEMLLQLQDGYQNDVGMPFYGWSFTLGPDGVIPRRFPHVISSFIDMDPQPFTSGSFLLAAVVQFRVFVIGETSATFRTCSETLAQIRSLLMDDFRKVWTPPWGRVFFDIEPAGVEEPSLFDEGDFRGFAGRVRFRATIEANAHGW